MLEGRTSLLLNGKTSLLDGDEAGKAVERLKSRLEAFFHCRSLVLSDDLDANDYLRNHGPSQLGTFIASAILASGETAAVAVAARTTKPGQSRLAGTIESTAAKTGRSMKNRENTSNFRRGTIGGSGFQSGVACRHAAKPRAGM